MPNFFNLMQMRNIDPMRQYQIMVQKFQEFQRDFQGDPNTRLDETLRTAGVPQQLLNWIQQVALAFRNTM